VVPRNGDHPHAHCPLPPKHQPPTINTNARAARCRASEPCTPVRTCDPLLLAIDDCPGVGVGEGGGGCRDGRTRARVHTHGVKTTEKRWSTHTHQHTRTTSLELTVGLPVGGLDRGGGDGSHVTASPRLANGQANVLAARDNVPHNLVLQELGADVENRRQGHTDKQQQRVCA
jgi:hypothetical protein